MTQSALNEAAAWSARFNLMTGPATLDSQTTGGTQYHYMQTTLPSGGDDDRPPGRNIFNRLAEKNNAMHGPIGPGALKLSATSERDLEAIFEDFFDETEV